MPPRTPSKRLAALTKPKRCGSVTGSRDHKGRTRRLGRRTDCSQRVPASHPPFVHMGAPIRPHVRTDHPAARTDHPRAKSTHRRLVCQPVTVERPAVVASSRDTVDEQVAASVRADVAQRYRLEGLLVALDDHDRPQSSSANLVTAGALGSSPLPSLVSGLTDTTRPCASTRSLRAPSDTHARTRAAHRARCAH
jgi:hypothetical protein